MLRLIMIVVVMSIYTIPSVLLLLVFSILTFFNVRYREDVAHNINRLWGDLVFFLSGSTMEVRGASVDFSKPRIIVMNHQSAFDIFFSYAAVKGQFRWISKDLYFSFPFVGWAMRLAGYIPLKREKKSSAYKSMLMASETIKKGRSLIIFPEGTRSRDGQIANFKYGINMIAELNPDVEILPVIICGTKDIMEKDKFDIKPANILVSILEPQKYKDIADNKHERIKKLRDVMVKEYEKLLLEYEGRAKQK